MRRRLAAASRRDFNPARDPLVEAQPLGLRARRRAVGNFRIDAQGNLAALGSIRRFNAFGAKGEVVRCYREMPARFGQTFRVQT